MVIAEQTEYADETEHAQDAEDRHVRDDAGTAAVGKPPRVGFPGLLLGFGLGGFVDGIVLHQVLQWHHMLSNTPDDSLGLEAYPIDTVDGLETNTLVDGFFHVGTWIAVVLGLAVLWLRVVKRPGPWSGRALLGAILTGWGVFNLVEGVVSHHILEIHHVRMEADVDDVLLWDLGFLASGAVLLALGVALHRWGRRTIDLR